MSNTYIIRQGQVDIEGLELDGAEINVLVAGVAAGYKLARGVVAITASPQTVVTGLDTVVAVVVSLRDDPTVTHLMSTATIGNQDDAPAPGSIIIESWKPTAVDNVTPIAATTPWSAVNWVAIGT